MKKVILTLLCSLLFLSCNNNNNKKKELPSWANEPFSFMNIEIGAPVSSLDSLSNNPKVRALLYNNKEQNSRWFETDIEKVVATYNTTLIDGNKKECITAVTIYAYKDKISKIHIESALGAGDGLVKLYSDKYGVENRCESNEEHSEKRNGNDPIYHCWANSLNQKIYCGEGYISMADIHFQEVIYADLKIFDEEKVVNKIKEDKLKEESKILQQNADIKQNQDI